MAWTERRKECPIRHENGNCLCVGGFCTAVSNEICEAVRMAYSSGYFDGRLDGYSEAFLAGTHHDTDLKQV